MPGKFPPVCLLSLVIMLTLLLPGIAAAVELTQDDIDFRKEVFVNKEGQRLPYRLFVPLGYDKGKKYPLLLWLHGSAGRGSDNVKQLTGGNQPGTHLWIAPAVQIKFPVFVLAPQCPAGEAWAEPEFNQPGKALLLTVEALGKIEQDFPVDPDRIYIAGQSLGGIGVWSLLQNYRGKWAGAIVLCAYDTFSNVSAIAEVPLWVFQGDADPLVPVTMLRSMIAQLKKANAPVRYTEYRKVGHEVWTKAFAEPELLPWLSTQRRRGQGR